MPSAPDRRYLPNLRGSFVRESVAAAWTERLRLDDGRVLLARPIQPGDAEPLAAGFELLDPEEIRMRFLRPLTQMTPALAHRLTHVDRDRELALVIAEDLPVGEALLAGVGRAVISDDHADADFALLVSRFVGRFGLGEYLLRRLMDWARRKGVDRIGGDVLEDNGPMLNLARRLGFSRRVILGEPGLVRLELQLPRRRSTP